MKGASFLVGFNHPTNANMSAITFDTHKELPGEHIVVMSKAEKLAALRKNIAIKYGYNRIDSLWSFMRVKNIIRMLKPT